MIYNKVDASCLVISNFGKYLTKRTVLRISAVSCIVLFLFAAPLHAQANRYRLKASHQFPSEIKESSGLEWWNEGFWTFNDSGIPELFMLDINGGIQKRFLIPAPRIHDWEDLAQDDSYLYLADTGNNSGRRDTLSIIKLDKEWLRRDSIVTDLIQFVWPAAKDGKRINYDCEAIVAHGDSLLLFTKEWKPRRSQVFSLSKLPGLQSAQYNGKIKTRLLITGATMDSVGNRILLIGYNRWLKPKLLQLKLPLANMDVIRPVRVKARIRRSQAEGICHIGPGSLVITTEAFNFWLFRRMAKLLYYKM